jgi:hypothetical protein
MDPIHGDVMTGTRTEPIIDLNRGGSGKSFDFRKLVVELTDVHASAATKKGPAKCRAFSRLLRWPPAGC